MILQVVRKHLTIARAYGAMNEICIEYDQSIKPDSGLFVNRIPDLEFRRSFIHTMFWELKWILLKCKLKRRMSQIIEIIFDW